MRCQIHTTASGSGESPAEWWYRAGIEVLDEVRGLCAAAGQWQAREVEAGDASAGSATGAAPLGGLGTSISRTPAMRQRATVTKTILDQMATGTRALTDGWDPFGRLLGGSWVYGGDAPGFWWGQLRFRAGPKTELLTPAGPGAAFLERFLASHGAGPHHFTFTVPDIAAALSRVRAAGIEPVQISLLNAAWKEAFLHPKDAYGIVIQVAEQSGPPPELQAPAQLPAPGPWSAFTLVAHHVADIDGATKARIEAVDRHSTGTAAAAAAAS